MSVQPTALADMMGLASLPRAQGLIALVSGFGGLLSTPVLGNHSPASNLRHEADLVLGKPVMSYCLYFRLYI